MRNKIAVLIYSFAPKRSQRSIDFHTAVGCEITRPENASPPLLDAFSRRLAVERPIISEMPVFLHANSAINFRFLRALSTAFFVPPLVAHREIRGMPAFAARHPREPRAEQMRSRISQHSSRLYYLSLFREDHYEDGRLASAPTLSSRVRN